MTQGAVYGGRYVDVSDLSPCEAGDAVFAATGDTRWAPENRCASCEHPENDHLDASDRGWCTKPTGTCIFTPCHCKTFVRKEHT